MKHLYKQKKYEEVEETGYKLLFNDMDQPLVLDTLSKALSKLKRSEEAAAYLTYFHRQLLERGTDADKRKYLASTGRRLETLSKKHQSMVQRRSKSADGRVFKDNSSVGELWMTGVTLKELGSIHGQYAWKLVGGRKKFGPDWVHNKYGIMHRSGLKYVREVDGRKGLLFSGAMHNEQNVHPSLTITNPGKCKFVRVGVRGYAGGGRKEFLTIEARGDDKTLGEQEVSTREWSDVEFNVTSGEMPLEEVTIEFRKKTPNSEGIWFDYIEFFDN